MLFFFSSFWSIFFPLDLDPWIRIFLRIRIQEAKILRLQRAGEGRRPWATTISPSVPHISFFLFRQPWVTTISPSVPPFDYSWQNYFFKWYIWPLKCDFKKSSRVTQKSTTQTIFSILLKIDILCVEFLNCFTIKFLTNLTEYCILKYHKVG